MSGTRRFNQALASWDVGHVTAMVCMFCMSAYNQPLEAWDVSQVFTMWCEAAARPPSFFASIPARHVATLFTASASSAP